MLEMELEVESQAYQSLEPELERVYQKHDQNFEQKKKHAKSLKKQMKSLYKHGPNFCVKQEMDNYYEIEEHQNQAFNNMSRIENKTFYTIFGSIITFFIGYGIFIAFHRQFDDAISFILLTFIWIVSAFGFSFLMSVSTHELLTRIFSKKYKMYFAQYEQLSALKQTCKRNILKRFNQPASQAQLIHDINDYGTHMDTLLGEGFSSNFKVFNKIKMKIGEIFQRGKKTTNNEALWEQLFAFYSIHYNIEYAQNDLKRKTKKMQTEEKVKTFLDNLHHQKQVVNQEQAHDI